ncbi:hypothetical protein HPB52_006940 [Rhipicephalus sanguineus]|uniref:Nose resistant-to-fluoxetine protein N-terminal domain-containing protein n=1 Tax=Rhipicephalus sanguineus TaxID=34632 RepID=A0A9D4T7B6_RHISA|nr:hypothetical protein HPB52_006940 [Rhipicephalus sanguineus]
MTAEEKAATISTRVSTSRSIMDVMPTESTGAINTSWLTTPPMIQAQQSSKFLSDIQAMIKELMSTVGSELTRKLLRADISTDCTIGLLQFTRAIQDLEPWAMRLIDATAKYPTGFLQGTVSDLGAYDECIETVVRDEYGTTKMRGQYCDVHLSIGDEELFNEIVSPAVVNYNRRLARFKYFFTDKSLPGMRLGVCFIDTCKEQDLANIGSIPSYYKCITAFSLAGNSKRILQITDDGNPETQCYSGYLLYFALNKQKQNRAIVAVIALIRRLIRVTVPVFFMIMCMYLLPLIASGPNSKEFYDRFHAEVRDHWWDLIAQVRNWRGEDLNVATMAHLWYLSADFQLFVVAVAVIQTFRTDVMETATQYYELPFYHAVCYFSGCMTFIFVEQYGKAKISKVDWNLNGDLASQTKRTALAFIDRILWSVFMAWFWFSCATGRGGFINRFLSWDGFVPLGRLSFGVYLVHVPFYHLMHRISRERRFYSHFVLVSNCFVVLVWSYILSYILCVTCELPTAHLEKLVFVRDPKKGDGTMKEPQKQQQVMGEDVANITVVSINQGTSKNCCDQG